MKKQTVSVLTLRLSEQEVAQLNALADLLGTKTHSKTILNLVMNGVYRIQEDKKQRAFIQELNFQKMEMVGLLRKIDQNEKDRIALQFQVHEAIL